MKSYFTISELCVSDTAVPQLIADKILKYHITPMNKVRSDFGKRIYCKDSKGNRSGFRTYRWEVLRNRSGESEHTFGQGPNGVIDLKAKGAVDWRCDNFQVNKNELLKHIIQKTNYTRIVIYPFCFHCDYKDVGEGKRVLYKSNSKNEWTYLNRIK